MRPSLPFSSKAELDWEVVDFGFAVESRPSTDGS
jgi:hypothetical protein